MGVPNEEHTAYIKHFGTSEFGIAYSLPTADHPTTPGFDSELKIYIDASLGGPHFKGRMGWGRGRSGVEGGG